MNKIKRRNYQNLSVRRLDLSNEIFCTFYFELKTFFFNIFKKKIKFEMSKFFKKMNKLTLIFMILLVASTRAAPARSATRGANCLNVCF